MSNTVTLVPETDKIQNKSHKVQFVNQSGLKLKTENDSSNMSLGTKMSASD